MLIMNYLIRVNKIKDHQHHYQQLEEIHLNFLKNQI